MNKLSFLLCILLMVGLLSCSSKSSQDDNLTEDASVIEMAQDDSETLEIAEDSIKDEGATEESIKEDAQALQEPQENMAEAMPAAAEASSIKTSGIENYEVQAGDTLMLIAFKIYGDYLKWRSLAELNNDKLAGNYNLEKGMQLKYESPASRFNWNPAGDPYLIARGDTLGKISTKLYNTPKHWQDIWENNKPMIKSPSLIFAGFTLYYLPLRDLASR
ncbi:MAG: hypothetical protein A2381_06505 [Bdellovibrionales bacterium RIFOXYB1_FULL_37_110]|nr:MAG: hypothetical protein A2181_08525 [Bdellovibrionales bacterium RIFOXYA1_FULL_38_20]OFZ50193.1 MAG: hypothetical protein A2417_19355 [Bdellovibrionales bacterium RIFOXYC1_FULL_37_79]OFZ57630.1 MAG: hypothetical protein A2381_06505 [Bdellovibrionales bacterium RIFOXYB1_FULL_37_110]OFZ61397.1 MAG: hypothetical protein A2577_00870 [Bdellovibrionales bacterium RIFOXYD1_FULL_36_51]